MMIRFFTAVVLSLLRSHVGKPRSAYGCQVVFPQVLRFLPIFDHDGLDTSEIFLKGP